MEKKEREYINTTKPVKILKMPIWDKCIKVESLDGLKNIATIVSKPVLFVDKAQKTAFGIIEDVKSPIYFVVDGCIQYYFVEEEERKCPPLN